MPRSAFALVLFSLLLSRGYAVAQDTSLSAAARQQLTADLVSQAVAFEHGEGVPLDPQRAIDLYCKAARYGSSEARYDLGWMYANGRGVARDDDVAATLFGMAAAQGYEPAVRILTHMPPPGAPPPQCLTASPQDANDATSQADTDNLDAYVASLPKAKQSVADLVRGLAPQYKINPRLALAVAMAESNLNVAARSDRGAQGVMQLMPDTASRFGVSKIYEPGQNIRGGLAYLRWLLSYYRGDVMLVLAAYNAGEGAVDRYGGIPPYAETVTYVKRITAFFTTPTHPFDDALAGPSPITASR